MQCSVGVLQGEELLSYSFPAPHPFTSERAMKFWQVLKDEKIQVKILSPQKASEEVIGLFHTQEHIRYVKMASQLGYGALDQGDTPVFPGVFEAAQYVVGSTLFAAEKVLQRSVDHAFNPVGGLHHARRGASAGFCVFNDVGVLVEVLRSKGLRRILYVDIDVHHGDGVFYEYEEDPDLAIFDVHEDGRYLYPGTGREEETGKGRAAGTKVNIPLLPGAGDNELLNTMAKLENLARRTRPEFIIFQAGADGLAGDPLASLRYSEKAHLAVTGLIHRLSHELCDGKVVCLGGGGYLPENCAKAWTAVVGALAALESF